jgi:hypothetical protein
MSKLFKIENSNLDEKFNINTDYANNYNNWRQKEELHKCKSFFTVLHMFNIYLQ